MGRYRVSGCCAQGCVIGEVKNTSHLSFESNGKRLDTPFGALSAVLGASEMRHMSRR